MKKGLSFILLLFYLFLPISGSLYGIGEKTISIGGASDWGAVEKRSGITEVTRVRPRPVLVLSSAAEGKKNPPGASPPDLALSFDEPRPEFFRDQTGHYRIIVNSPEAAAENSALTAADRRWARAGTGAALFSGAAAPLIIEPLGQEALFSPDNSIRDFTLEFWLYPLNMSNGEQILSWISSRPLPRAENRTGISGGDYVFQRIQCTAVKNRFQWSFLDFFSGPGGSRHVDLTLTGSTPVVPKTWSHHLIRFDSDTGLLEYLVNGNIEAIDYASSTRREGGEVYTPVLGEGGSFTLGSRFMGLMDEFRIYGDYIAETETGKYSPRGGRMETRAVDLGEGNSGILKVEAFGGRTSVSGGILLNEYAGSGGKDSSGPGGFLFNDDSAVQFFARAADNPYHWTDADWRPFVPGAPFPEDFRGRYVQFAADFYPSGDNETSPYLEEIRITYRPDEAPLPPSAVNALARDGAVLLSWKPSPDRDARGYLVYYGTARGEYFGENALPGDSPIDAGNRTSLSIEGLENGILYYFSIAAYDRRLPAGPENPAGSGDLPGFHAGDFSREVSARPLRMAE